MICITRLSLIIYYGPNGCTCCHHPHHGHKEGFFNEASVKFNSDVLAEFLRNIYHGFDTSNEVEPTMWREILRIINEATVEGLSKAQTPPTHDKLFYEALRHSNEVFAAFKVHTMGVDMAAKLFDDKGKLKPFKQWVDDVSSISSHQVGSWLQTEYDTAVIRAHQAADWREFMRNKDVMPNLRWMPTTSSDPETTHEAFWQKRLNLPVDDPFWTKHHPGDHWNCKCSLEANDDAVVRPEDTSVDKPQPGLDNNPGKDGHIFNDTHPYFPSDCRHCPFNKGFKNKAAAFFKNEDKDCNNCSKVDAKTPDNASTLKKERNAIKIEAKTSLTSETFRNNDFPHEVKISGAGIKEWLNQPHEHYREKNKALLKLKELFEKAKYLGPTIDEKKRENVLYSHIFETKISGDKSWIIVHQMKWGEYYIHSISDSEKVASKKKKGL